MTNDEDDRDATPGPSEQPDPADLEGGAGLDDDDDLEVERALVERAQAGDRRAFRDLYKRHARALFHFPIMPLVRNRDTAEDILSETFVRAMQKLPNFQWRGRGLRPWLNIIARNLCLDHLRKRGRVRSWPEGFEQSIPDASDSDAEDLLGRAEMSEICAARIETCLAELNPRYRRVIELRIIEKQARVDAAAALEVTIGTLDVLLFRACRAFRKVYGSRYDD